MTEVGYRSIDGAAISPGSWATAGTPNTTAQADAYNAFFQVWAAHGGSWMKGIELWQWDLSTNMPARLFRDGKTAEDIVSQYFPRPMVPYPISRSLDHLSPTSSISARAITSSNAGLGDDVIHGGAGNDVIVGGPSVAESSATT